MPAASIHSNCLSPLLYEFQRRLHRCRRFEPHRLTVTRPDETAKKRTK